MTVDPDLRCLSWEGYEAGAIPAEFEAKTGLMIAGASHLSDHWAAQKVVEERGAWDFLNINTPFVRDFLHLEGLIHPLGCRFAERLEAVSDPYKRFAAAATGRDGLTLGVPQRFGPFNLVVNSKRLSKETAADLGFQLPLVPRFRRRYGILAYDDFNVMHVALSAGLNPFEDLDAASIARFEVAASAWHENAAILSSDHGILNTALVDGEIDFYLSGGVYTASSARLAGRDEILAVTPLCGPMNGKGGVAFVEVNALLNGSPSPNAAGVAFLDFIAGLEGSMLGALAAGSCNPIVQMCDRAVFAQFTSTQLDALQWETLHEDLDLCADYALIPNYRRLLPIIFKERMRTGRGRKIEGSFHTDRRSE